MCGSTYGQTYMRPNKIFKYMSGNGVTNRLGLQACIILSCKFHCISFVILGIKYFLKIVSLLGIWGLKYIWKLYFFYYFVSYFFFLFLKLFLDFLMFLLLLFFNIFWVLFFLILIFFLI